MSNCAVALGWPAAAVEVIDEDQGYSGSSVEGRNGFQRLLAEVSPPWAQLMQMPPSMEMMVESGPVQLHLPLSAFL
ncbi:MAG: hypothetical protein ACYC3X_27640 [Pirellulaceae bacterium]